MCFCNDSYGTFIKVYGVSFSGNICEEEAMHASNKGDMCENHEIH